MRIAVLADIHGNLPALRTVIEEVRGASVELILSCGDLASGPLPTETLDYLADLEIPFWSVQGNADRGAVLSSDGAGDRDDLHGDDVWTGTQLTPRHRDYLAGLPPTISLEVEGVGEILVCHGTPRCDDEIVVETTPEWRVAESLEGVQADVVLCGNTHMQFDRTVGDIRLINVGSVGWPYGSPGAYWALLDRGIDLKRTAYDLEAAAEQLRARSKWPRIEAFLSYLPAPPAAEDAVAFFESAAD